MQDLSGESSSKSQKPNPPVYLKDYTPPAYWVEEIDLKFDIYSTCVEVNATLSMRRNPNSTETKCFLTGTGLTLKQIEVDGEVLISTDKELKNGDFVTVEITGSEDSGWLVS